MATTYTWEIIKLSTLDTNEKVIIRALWMCTGSDGKYSSKLSDNWASGVVYNEGEANEITAQSYTVSNMILLKEQDVLDWIWSNGVDQTDIETKIDAKIQAQVDANAGSTDIALPWKKLQA